MKISDNCRTASTRLLTKVLVFLEVENKPVIKQRIREAVSDSSKISDALNWLVNHKLVKRDKTLNNQIIYSIEEDARRR